MPGKITSKPASHLSSLCNQMVNFLGIMQNEWAGAQAFSSFDTYLAPFVKADNLTYEEIEAVRRVVRVRREHAFALGHAGAVQQHHAGLGCARPTCAISRPSWAARSMDFTYGDCKVEMDMVNKAFIEIMIEGDANGRGFQYPIPTYSITRDFDWSETENNRLLFEMTSKYGTPYFSNYINSDMEPSDVRSMCCRLRLDLRELRKKSGGFFGSGESTGSIGVVTINMPRLAYLSARRSRLLPSTRPAHGRCRALAATRSATVVTQPAGCGLVPVHQALPGHVREPLLHDRPGGHERGVPERAVAAR